MSTIEVICTGEHRFKLRTMYGGILALSRMNIGLAATFVLVNGKVDLCKHLGVLSDLTVNDY